MRSHSRVAAFHNAALDWGTQNNPPRGLYAQKLCVCVHGYYCQILALEMRLTLVAGAHIGTQLATVNARTESHS